jgi:hypothetical protein
MRLTIAIAVITIVIGVGVLVALRGRTAVVARIGGLYSTAKDEDGKFGIIKVLAVDSKGVHVSIYQNRFLTRPSRLEETALTFGTVHDSESPGIMHVPLSRAAFERWQPKFIQQSTVKPDELEPLAEWRDASGGYWP